MGGDCTERNYPLVLEAASDQLCTSFWTADLQVLDGDWLSLEPENIPQLISSEHNLHLS